MGVIPMGAKWFLMGIILACHRVTYVDYCDLWFAQRAYLYVRTYVRRGQCFNLHVVVAVPLFILFSLLDTRPIVPLPLVARNASLCDVILVEPLWITYVSCLACVRHVCACISSDIDIRLSAKIRYARGSRDFEGFASKMCTRRRSAR